MRNRKNNLLIITFDQLRGDWVNGLGERFFKLENFRKISQNAWEARRCYTISPQCVPSRLSWLTGMEASRLGITRNMPVSVTENTPSIFRNLNSKEISTYLIGKTHWTSHGQHYDLRDNRNLLKSLGFDESIEIAGPRGLANVSCELTDEWMRKGYHQKYVQYIKERKHNSNKCLIPTPTILPDDLYPDIWIYKKSVEVLDNISAEKPWLLWISFVGPHEPFDTPKRWNNRVKRNEIPEPSKLKNDWLQRIAKESHLGKTIDKWQGKMSLEEIMNIRQDYADNLILLDELLGKIYDKVQARQDSEKTDILITSDHGEMLGDGGMLYKSTFIESSIRVPFIYRRANGKKEGKYTQPINCHELLKEVVSDDGFSFDKYIEERKAHMAVSEFADEIVVISKNFKITFNLKGSMMWKRLGKNRDLNRRIKTKLLEDKQKYELRPEGVWDKEVLKRNKNNGKKLEPINTVLKNTSY